MIEFLPQYYQTLPVIKWLWEYLESFELSIIATVNNILIEYLSIDLGTSRGLDFIASKNGLDAIFWDRNWTVNEKRMLLQNYRKILTEMGNKDFINWLFGVFQLNSKLTTSTGWKLDVSQFPITFGGSIFDYTIKVDPSYAIGTQQRALIEKIIDTFVPDFITVTITTQ